jgi:LysR family hydrogen peroxide-inducible transcriptional activator
MNDRQLRYALAVRDELSFSRAAENLLISQPSISEQVGALEQELGFPLFRRTGRGIKITEPGQVFLNQAQEVMDGLLSLTNLARRLRPGLTSSFSMGMSTSLVNFLFPLIAEAFASDFPNVQLSVMSAIAPQIQSLVAQADLDVGFTVEFSAKSGHPTLTWEEIAMVDMALFMRPNHPLAGEKIPIDLTKITDEPLIMHNPSIGYGLLIHSMFTSRGLKPNIVATADSPTAIKTMIQSGMGIAILPALAARGEISLGQLVHLPIHPKRTVSLCLIRQTKGRGSHIETCIAHIRDTLRKYDWSPLCQDGQ